MGGRGSSSSMGGGMGIAATQQQPQNAPPFAVPQSIKINAGNIITRQRYSSNSRRNLSSRLSHRLPRRQIRRFSPMRCPR